MYFFVWLQNHKLFEFNCISLFLIIDSLLFGEIMENKQLIFIAWKNINFDLNVISFTNEESDISKKKRDYLLLLFHYKLLLFYPHMLLYVHFSFPLSYYVSFTLLFNLFLPISISLNINFLSLLSHIYSCQEALSLLTMHWRMWICIVVK